MTQMKQRQRLADELIDMSKTRDIHGPGKRHALVSALCALALFAGPSAVHAQDGMQHRLPAFQAPASDSLETSVLSRLAQTGEYLPDDLPRLARLAVLNSIAMRVNVRADLPDSILGEQLDQDITALSNDSQTFFDFVNSSFLDDDQSLERAAVLLAAVAAGHERVQSTLGTLPGLSGRAAENLQSFSKMLEHADSLMGVLESNASNLAPPGPEPAAGPDSLRRQAQIAANLLVELIGKVGDAGRGRPARDPLVTDLTETLDRLQSFSRLLSLDPSLPETQDSFRDALRPMWRAESRLVHTQARAGLEPHWRVVRERMNAISDALQLPRVIVLSSDRGAVRPDRKLDVIPSGSSVKSPATPIAARSSARLPGPRSLTVYTRVGTPPRASSATRSPSSD
jgi:hypothetical protein